MLKTMVNVINVLHLFILFTGIYAYIHTLRLKKKGEVFAAPYMGFIVCWNLFILEMFVFSYLRDGNFGLLQGGTWSAAIILWDSIFRSLCVFGSLFFFVQILSLLSAKARPKKLNFFLATVFIPLCFLLGVGSAFSLFKSNVDLITITQNYTINGSLFLLLVFTIWYNHKNRMLPEGSDRNRAIAFGKFYTLVFFVAAAIFILALWNLFSYLLIIAFFLLMNFFPPTWYRQSVYYAELEKRHLQNLRIMEGLKETHKLTPREEEIGLLLLEGFNSQEIQEALFISLGTVKNHIYNLNRKLGIGSREELVRLFSDLYRNEYEL
ncbi:helix-turn-helix transcriptional regulator [Acidobacteriota bacterium]